MPAPEVPFARLGIPQDLRGHVSPDAPRASRLAAARGAIPAQPEVVLALCYVLAGDSDLEIREAAAATVRGLPATLLASAIHPNTHSKVLEYAAVLRASDPEVAARIYQNLNANDRTAILIAEQAGPDLCERIVDNKHRLLMTPAVLLALHRNRNCSNALLERAASFLRMERQAPDMPARRPWEGTVGGAGAAVDLEAEVEAAIGGLQSPAMAERTREALAMFDLGDTRDGGPLAGFSFDFRDEASSFSMELVEDRPDDHLSDRERQALEKTVHDLPIGQKVRLAYLGNKQVRQALIRDNNKMVAVAVVRSGRCTDAEITAVAANRNAHDEVLREVAQNREWIRKYPVRVSLVNNPKTPVSTAVSLVSSLQLKDLADLSRNHNVSSVVTTMAQRLVHQRVRSKAEGRDQK